MFKELKHTMFKGLKENMKAITQQRGNVNKEIEFINKNQIEILKLRSVIK